MTDAADRTAGGGGALSQRRAAGDITRLLLAWRNGSAEAGDELLPRLYGSLRRIAAGRLRGRHDVSWQATELVHEMFLKLARSSQPQWQGRDHFLAVAVRLMRDVIVDKCRRRDAIRRGGGVPDRPLEVSDAGAHNAESAQHSPIERQPPFGSSSPHPVDLLALHEALDRLAGVSSEAAQLVELRFFAGFGAAEAAALTGLSHRTAKRRWQFAKAWLLRELEGGDGG